ncbi:carboxymuconolactone decarboxylase family protein [Halorientalis brevis]|uniref:Carboxymuconolactone decarboxylase family protein n=1 Tax=Halorientalis brevis TaxID=1126241 RepID=A0ABD6CFP7_9EURY|nr:carboxymuconolactone decarboxylase family protein [Halorientalis brevis]
MPDRLSIVEPGESADQDVNALLREATEDWYEDAAFFGAMAHQPAIFKRLVETLGSFPQSDAVSSSLLELVRLRVATCHECAYCGTVRTTDVRDEVAPKEAAVLGDEIDQAALTRREALAVELADAMSRDPHRITDEFFADLHDEFATDELVELLLFCSLEVGLDRFTIALELDTTEDSPYPTGLEYPLTDPQSREQ